jgi:NADH:ubiquinone oxidoreductase subunit 5 (subunit L)/multisubunit Na+/H+ antiporter MnhA subunit
MREFFNSSSEASIDWLVFIAILLAVCFAIGIFIIWFTVFRKKGKKRRKHRHHRHRKNPTLAETGGLPPKRHPQQPPNDVL